MSWRNMAKTKAKKQVRQRYLAIPYQILNLCDIGLCQKVLLAHIYSFGVKGCYQSNKTLSKVFMVSPDTISRWISELRGYIYIKSPKGYYRTIWAKSHQQVQEAARSHYKAKQTPKAGRSQNTDHGKNTVDPRQKCTSDCGKSAIGLRQNCGTTNNNTNKETNKDTTPLSQMQEQIEQFKKSFGMGKKPSRVRLNPEQFEQRRGQMIKALMAGGK